MKSSWEETERSIGTEIELIFQEEKGERREAGGRRKRGEESPPGRPGKKRPQTLPSETTL